MTLLPIIEACDNFRVESSNELLIPLLLQPPSTSTESQFPLGFLRPQVVQLLKNERDGGHWFCDDNNFISFAPSLRTSSERTAVVEALVKKWIEKGLFSEITGGRLWRNELYAVYKTPFGPLRDENLAFAVERSAAAIFGSFTYGVHMNIWVDGRDGQMKVWVPTRSATKQTWPGCLDNSVAGGLPWGLSPFESMVKEAEEEASLEEAVIKSRIRSRGTVSYFTRTALGWLQPELQFAYDLELRTEDELVPKPSDGEVQSFELCSVPDIIEKMHSRRFKPNCALVLIDFLIRHAYITPENEPHYADIVTRLHGRAGFEQIY